MQGRGSYSDTCASGIAAESECGGPLRCRHQICCALEPSRAAPPGARGQVSARAALIRHTSLRRRNASGILRRNEPLRPARETFSRRGFPTAHRRARDSSTPQCTDSAACRPSPSAPITSLPSPPRLSGRNQSSSAGAYIRAHASRARAVLARSWLEHTRSGGSLGAPSLELPRSLFVRFLLRHP